LKFLKAMLVAPSMPAADVKARRLSGDS